MDDSKSEKSSSKSTHIHTRKGVGGENGGWLDSELFQRRPDAFWRRVRLSARSSHSAASWPEHFSFFFSFFFQAPANARPTDDDKPDSIRLHIPPMNSVRVALSLSLRWMICLALLCCCVCMCHWAVDLFRPIELHQFKSKGRKRRRARSRPGPILAFCSNAVGCCAPPTQLQLNDHG
jgi:hypothetical protein